MLSTPTPEPRQAFVEAYEFFSDDLLRDPKDFAVEWRAPQDPKFSAAKAGRWQSLVDKRGGPTGTFIAHSLPASQTIELRVLSADVPSDWVSVETKALPDPLTDVHMSDPFGNPLGGIKGLCKGWVLDDSNITLGSKVEQGLRCLRCGCATFRHSKREPGSQQQEEQQKLAAAKPKAQSKAKAAQPKAAGSTAQPKAAAASAAQSRAAAAAAQPTAAAQAKAAAGAQPAAATNGYPKAGAQKPKAEPSFEDELNAERPRNEEGRLPAPYVRAAFWNSLELQSEFLATDPPEFKVEWARIDEEGGEPGEAMVGAWANTTFRTRMGEDAQRMGLFMLDNLPAGSRIAVRLRDGERSSAWMRLRTRPAEGEAAAGGDEAGRVAAGASACSSFVAPAERGKDERCLRCGRAKGHHRREEPAARKGRAAAAQAKPEADAAAARPAPSEPWRPEELQGVRHEGAAGHPMPLPPGLHVAACGDVELVTNFDGSNGELLEGWGGVKVEKGEDGKPRVRLKKPCDLERLHVVLRPDPSDGTESTGRKRWFYFGVRAAEGVDPALLQGKRIRMVVNGMSDMTDLFNLDGHRPFVRNVPHQVAWSRIRDPSRFVCRYEGGGGRGSNVGDGGKFTIGYGEESKDGASKEDDSIPIAKLAEVEGCVVEDGMLAVASSGSGGTKRKKMRRCHIAWDFTFEYEGGTTYFAFSEPFGYEDLQEYLGNVEHFIADGPPPGTELPEYAPRARALPTGADAEVYVADGPYAGAWVKCQISGLGAKAGTVSIHVPKCEPVLKHDADFPNVPWEMLRETDGNSADWRPVLGEGVYFHRQRLCSTSDGRRVDLLTVSQAEADERAFVEAPLGDLSTCMPLPEAPVRDFGGRRVVFISARVHPGETPAQFAFFGFFQFLISNDPRARLLRQSFVFKLVPMMNPDGVGRGHTRANAKGFDLNRCYSNPRREDHEAVFHVLELLAHWSAEGRLLFYLDMHAHAHTRGCILYGNALKGAGQVWNIGFAHMCQLNTPHFDMEGSEFPPKTDKEHGGESLNSGRACVAALCRIYHAYTLECHYSTGRLTRPVPDPPGLETFPKHPGIAVKTFKQVRYGTHEFESIGEGIAVTLLDMHCRNPHSRLLVSRGKSLDGILWIVSKAIHADSPYGTSLQPPKAPGMDVPRELFEHSAQLWRVVHDQVIARDRPALTGRMVEMYEKGNLVLVADKPEGSPWVRLAVPGGRLGGRLGSVIRDSSEVFMLTDGSQKGLGMLLTPTGLWVRLSRGRSAEGDGAEYSVAVPAAWEVEARQTSAAAPGVAALRQQRPGFPPAAGPGA